jgi:hypothetical protein
MTPPQLKTAADKYRSAPPLAAQSDRVGNLLDNDICDFMGIWCLIFNISEVLHTRDSIYKDYPFIGLSTTKDPMRRQGEDHGIESHT